MAQYELLIHARRAVVDGRIQQAAVTVDGGVITSVRTGSEARDIGLAGDLLHDGKRMGLVLDVGGWYKNVITFAPSLDISYEEIDLAITLLDQALTKAKG